MGNEAVLKVFHAARQDIEIVWHRAGMLPHPIFDTQVAAMVLGYGDSIAYDALVEKVTGHRPDKTHRFTDWSRRPLSKEQIVYAEADVTHLRDVFKALDADLKKRGRSDWVSEEMEVLTSPAHLRQRTLACLGAAEDARAQAEGACGADGGRGLARARGADARRAAQPRAEGRCDRRHRHPRADDAGEARAPALDPEGF